MSDDRKPIAAYRDVLPIKQQAELGILPDCLTIAEIAALHPDGDAFARLLLEAYAVFRCRESADGKGLQFYPPIDPKKGSGLQGELLQGWELLDIVLHFPDGEPPLEPDPPADDIRNALVITVCRDDLRTWLREMELWPLIPDTALNAWWSDLLVENTPDQKGGADARILGQAIFKQREEALRTFLALEGIPADDWKFLKSRHGYTRKKVYLALVEYPAFRSVHGRGDPIKESQFMRKFWAEQDIAALE